MIEYRSELLALFNTTLTSMETDLQNLLNQIEVLLQREALLSPRGGNFNIFRILRPEHDEVKLHSRFLFELLNPKGSHGMGDIFLRSFALHCGFTSHNQPANLSFEKARVQREHEKIDLLIQDGKSAVIVENKIYAVDQPLQLQRYHEKVVSRNWKSTLYYLTLNGHDPSKESLGNLDPNSVQNISYAHEINNWLTECIQSAALFPPLRETIVQYQKLIHKLTGIVMSDTKENLIKLLAKNENAEQAALIVHNWQHVRHHTELQFWTELEVLVRNEFEISSSAHFDSKSIHVAINQSRKDTGYGLKFKLGDLYGVPLLFKINRGDLPITYGLPFPKSLDNSQEIFPSHLLQTLTNAFQLKETRFWLKYKVNGLQINFEGFSNSATLQLVNPAKRTVMVKNFWEEVRRFATECSMDLHHAFGHDFVTSAPPVRPQA